MRGRKVIVRKWSAKEMARISPNAWPRHADGSRKKIREMTAEQRAVVARGSVARLAPTFAADGISLEFEEDAS